jgi:hypothetical protein
LQGTVRRTAHSKPFVRCKTIAWSDQKHIITWRARILSFAILKSLSCEDPRMKNASISCLNTAHNLPFMQLIMKGFWTFQILSFHHVC